MTCPNGWSGAIGAEGVVGSWEIPHAPNGAGTLKPSCV